MKTKILILAMASIFLSCTNDEVETGKPCNCDKIARSQTGKYNQTTAQWVLSPWSNGSTEKNYSQDCSQDGKNWISTSQTSSDRKTIVNFGYVISCK